MSPLPRTKKISTNSGTIVGGNPNIVAGVFARGGSKGVPQKNLRNIAGKPLVAHAVETALACPEVSSVFISTDNPKIAEVANSYGAEVPFMRPPELSTDTVSEILAWRHALNHYAAKGTPIDILVTVAPTSPFTIPQDVSACIHTMLKHGPDLVLTVCESDLNPYFNMFEEDKQGNAKLVIKSNSPISRRQDAKKVFSITGGAYVARSEFVEKSQGIFFGSLRLVKVPQARALDINTDFDLLFAEFLHSRQ